jgi:hypothetical protein
MPTVAVHSFTDEDLHRFANQVKEVLIASLVNDGALDFDRESESLPATKDYERFCASYVVVVSRPGMFGRFWDKIFKTENGSIVTVLKSTLPSPGAAAPSPLKLIKDD